MNHTATTPASDELAVVDWRDRVFALYGEVRRLHADEPEAAFELFRAIRDDLFRHHPASPIPATARDAFEMLPYFDYRHDLNITADLVPTHDQPTLEIDLGDDGTLWLRQIAGARFEHEETSHELPVYWLEGYAGGIFVPFRDATNGTSTYGSGRYLFDSRKGANLGVGNGTLTLDFNFAYNPSCAYDPRWVCPLAPPASRLPFAILAGERAPSEPA